MAFASDRRTVLMGGVGAAAGQALPAGATRASARTFFDRHGLPIGIQVYALGEEAQKDFAGTMKRVAAIGYRDIELPGTMGLDPAEMRRAADDANLSISSIHVGTSGALSIRNDPQQLADMLGTLGARQIVVPLFPIPPGFRLLPGETVAAAIARSIVAAGGDMWKELAQLLNERAAALKPHGITLGYHNHNVEFVPVGTRTGWDILTAETDPALVHFEVDIGWIVSAGVDPLLFFKRYSGRVRQAHVKDVKRGFKASPTAGTESTEVGSGQIDWVRVLPAAYAAGVRNFYVEQEPPFAMPRIESAAQSYAYLARLRA